MPVGYSLQQIFNNVLLGQTQTVAFYSQKEYDSMRSALLRKWRDYLGLLNQLGAPNSFEGKYLKCSWKSEGAIGTFQLAEEKERSFIPGKTYNVVEL